MSLTIRPVSPGATVNHRDLTTDAIIVPIYEGGVLPTWLAPKTLAKSGFTGAKNDLHTEWSEDGERRYIFVGLGKPVDPANPFSVEATQSAAALVVKTAKRLKIVDAAMLMTEGKISSLYDVYMGFLLGDYEFTRKCKRPPPHEYTLTVAVPESYQGYEEAVQERNIDRALKVAAAIITVRDLVSDGANVVTPGHMIKVARNTAPMRVSCKIMGIQKLKEMGANLILAVNKGSRGHSDQEPALIHMTYLPWHANPNQEFPEIWFIGKGVTFDSGGLDIKTLGNMIKMRIDMAGAAVCVGVMQALAFLNKLDRYIVHCVMPVTENMTGPSAYKPGDIYTSMSGKTVEIGNTDAEGRLILADAITYAQNHGAKSIVTLATLTGAQMVALGPTAALYANKRAYDAGLVRDLQKAAQSTGEGVHPMPLDLRAKPLLRSKGGADICNFTGVPYAGACTAALFLDEFVDPGVAFVHLDISGAAYQWFSLGQHHIQDDMGTGFGVALLTEFLELVELR